MAIRGDNLSKPLWNGVKIGAYGDRAGDQEFGTEPEHQQSQNHGSNAHQQIRRCPPTSGTGFRPADLGRERLLCTLQDRLHVEPHQRKHQHEKANQGYLGCVDRERKKPAQGSAKTAAWQVTETENQHKAKQGKAIASHKGYMV